MRLITQYPKFRFAVLLTFLACVQATASAENGCVFTPDSQLTPVTTLGPRWTESAYDVWAQLIDTSLTRTNVSPQPSDFTQKVNMPFVEGAQGSCGIVVPRIQRPFHAHKVIQKTIACQAPHSDATPMVAQALQELAQSAKSGVGLELRFVPGCTYYFDSQTSGNDSPRITIPQIDDLTIIGGTSLADAATLIFANPVDAKPLVPGGGSPFLATPASTGPSAFADAFYINGGSRIAFNNLILGYQTPVTSFSSQAIQWNTLVPYVDFGDLSLDANGHQIITVHPNNGALTYFNPYIRIISQTSVAQPMDFDPTIPYSEADLGSAEITSFAVDGAGHLTFDLTEANGDKNTNLPVGPVKIFHAGGAANGGVVFKIDQNQGSSINDISLTNVQVFAAIGVVMQAVINDGLLLDNFNEVPLATSTVHATAGAGGIVVQVGADFVVKNSTFEYGGDDAINLYADMGVISGETVSNNPDGTQNLSIAVANGSLGPFNNLTSQSQICVTSSIFEPLICGPITGTSSKGGRFINMTVAAGSPALQNGDIFFDLSQPQNRVIIENNVFIGNRARAMTFKGSNALISNNTVTNVPCGIRVMPEVSKFLGGPMPRNILIRENEVDQSGNTMAYGAISSGIFNGDEGVTTNQMIRHLELDLNTSQGLIVPQILTSATALSLVNGNAPGNFDLSLYSEPGSWWSNPKNNLGQPLGPYCALP